jgi:hypothetical protein
VPADNRVFAEQEKNIKKLMMTMIFRVILFVTFAHPLILLWGSSPQHDLIFPKLRCNDSSRLQQSALESKDFLDPHHTDEPDDCEAVDEFRRWHKQG